MGLNTQNLIVNILVCSQGDDRRQYLEWLEQPNEMIGKSARFEQLVNHACIIFYKKQATNVSEDSVNFIRRSIHELLRSKPTKDQLHTQLMSSNGVLGHSIDMVSSSYEYVDNGMYVSAQQQEESRYLHNVIPIVFCKGVGRDPEPAEGHGEGDRHGRSDPDSGEERRAYYHLSLFLVLFPF